MDNHIIFKMMKVGPLEILQWAVHNAIIVVKLAPYMPHILHAIAVIQVLH